MTSNEEITSGLEAWQKAKAKSQAYKEFSDLVVKYDEKVTRQLNEAVSKYNRIKKHGTNPDAMYKAMDEMTTMKYKALEARNLSLEILQRSIDAIKDEERVHGEFNEMAMKALQEEDELNK